MTVREAREYLGISKTKIARFIADGTLASYESALNKRIKLLRRADVEALAHEKPRPKTLAA